MPRVGFERKIPVFEQAKTIHSLDRAATVIGKPTHLFMGKSVKVEMFVRISKCNIYYDD
jgi:hypothetical protein